MKYLEKIDAAYTMVYLMKGKRSLKVGYVILRKIRLMETVTEITPKKNPLYLETEKEARY